MSSIALWLSRRLVTQDKAGNLNPPGAGAGAGWTQKDGTEIALISRGDALDLYIGRNNKYNLTLEPKTAVAMAIWLLRWWRRTMWFGLKLRLWNWALGELVAHHEEKS